MKRFLSVSVSTLCRMLAVIVLLSAANPFAFADSKESLLQKRKMYLEQRYAGKTTAIEKIMGARGEKRSAAKKAANKKTSPMLSASAAGSDVLYGFLMSDETEDYLPGLVTISLDGNATTSLMQESFLNISAGTCVLNDVYLQTYSSYTLEANGLYAKDIETGEERLITSYTGDDPRFMDMTYDENRGMIYAVGATLTDELMSIYSISPATGEYEQLFYIDYILFTLAASSDGYLYGINDYGELFRISVDYQSCDYVEWTGYFPAYLQSMTYNPNDGLLYWGLFTEEGTSSLLTVETEYGMTEVVSETLGNNAEIGALFFRSDPTLLLVPAASSNLNVFIGSNGQRTATISWKNPTTSLDGNPLTSIDRIEVSRNGIVVHEISNPTVGANETWDDTDIPQGMTTYSIVAINEYGNGDAAESIPIYIGRDVPSTVNDLVLAKTGEGYELNLTWTAPLTGKHNGWFDNSTLRYNVIRYPDASVVAENLTECSYTDATITETNGYSYGVVAINDDGASDTLRSNVVIVGPALEVPYSCTFNTEAERNMWIIEDANGDNCTWYYDHNWGGVDSYFMHYYYNEDCVTAADDWFFSAPIHLEAGKLYMLSYDVRMISALGQEKFRVALCSGTSHEYEVQEIDNRTDFQCDNIFTNASTSFTPETTGDYSLGFQVYSDANQYFIHITNISVKETNEVDMVCNSLKGMEVAVKDVETTYEVTVTNNGAAAIEAFTVNVADVDGTVYGSVNVEYNLGINASLIVPVKCTITSNTDTQLVGQVVADGDAVSDNNTTASLEVDVLQDAEYNMVKIGHNTGSVCAYVPFDLSVYYSVTQMLFNPNILGFASTSIERIGYNYGLTWGDTYAKNIKLKIYMANIEEVGSLSGWLDPEIFTLVYDGEFSLDEDNNALMLTLDTPFNYEGNELAVMTETEGGGEEYFYNCFNSSTEDISDENFYSMSWSENEYTFDPTVQGMETRIYPDFTFILNNDNGAVNGVNASSYKVYTMADKYISIVGEYDKAALYSIDGMLIQEANGENTIGVANCKQGIYLLQVRCGESVKTHKIVVRH